MGVLPQPLLPRRLARFREVHDDYVVYAISALLRLLPSSHTCAVAWPQKDAERFRDAFLTYGIFLTLHDDATRAHYITAICERRHAPYSAYYSHTIGRDEDKFIGHFDDEF